MIDAPISRAISWRRSSTTRRAGEELFEQAREARDRGRRDLQVLVGERRAGTVDLDQGPDAGPRFERQHRERLEAERLQDRRLAGIDVVVAQREAARLPRLEHELRLRVVRHEIAVAELERPAV